jgi:predicted GH43/DUF377 family glycosyl hydrolase
MTYVAFGPLGPKPALAVSVDGQSWRRLGPICFEYADELNTDLNLFPNKDVVVFPEVVPDPDGHPSYAILHRPMWDLSFARPGEPAPLPAGIEDARAGIWISYVDADAAVADLRAFARPHSHRWLAGPSKPWEALKIGAGPTPGPNNPENYSVAPWEDLKIGAGPAPLRVPEGWLLIYHGVTGRINGLGSFVPQDGVHYVAAAMILDPADPSRVLARTSTPLLEPATESETSGAVPNVVFPTAIEKIGSTHYVFYGMADSMIGVARLDRTDTTA